MSKSLLLLIALLSLSVTYPLYADEEPIRLFMADGQLKTHPVRVFVNRDITEGMKPILVLNGSRLIAVQQTEEQRRRQPMLIARHQTLQQTANDSTIAVTGTLLLFDLSHYPMPFFKTAERLTPTLIWQDEQVQQQLAIGDREIYLANTGPAFLIPLLLVFLLLWMLIALSRFGGKPAINFIRSQDGSLSLSKTQVALWTLAIGGMIMAYGLMRVVVPAIPESLIALMGLSLATGGISYTQSTKATIIMADSSVATSAPSQLKTPRIADLVVDYAGSEQGNLSLTRAQMVFWTLLTLFLFVIKSTLEGTLWDVPWQLVALMGLSHASYLAPKLSQTPMLQTPTDKSTQ